MILVTAATGNVGSHLVSALRSQGEPVRALVRGLQQPLPEGVELAVGDLEDTQSVARAMRDCQGLFLLAGYGDVPGLLSAAAREGVGRIVLLSGGGAVATNTDNVISQYQLRSERAVSGSGLSWTILRPFAFMSNALRWTEQLRRGDVVTVPFPNVANATIDPYDIAQVAAVALSAEGHAGQIYRLSGPQALRPADQVGVLGGLLGRDLLVDGQSDERARTEMEATMPHEYVDAFFSFYVDGSLDESRVLPTVEQVSGKPPQTFAQWAQRHLDAFGGGQSGSA